MEFHGLKIDFIGLSQLVLAVTGLATLIKGVSKNKRAREQKKEEEKTP